MRPADDLAAAAVRIWTRSYTARLEPGVREARRAEIDSDLWEHAHAAREAAADPRSVAGQILARCLLGIAADLTWRSQMAAGPGRLVKEGVSMNDRIKQDWWIPAPIVLLGLSALAVLTHIVGDGLESAWSRTASGWNPSLPERVGVVALLFFLFVVLPVWALTIRRRHPGLTVVMLMPLGLYSLVPLMWGEVTWWTLLSVLAIVTLVGAIVNLAQRSLEEGPALSSPEAQHTRG
jgi:CDP-diglyceride synthetase